MTLHSKISYAKSGARIIAYLILLCAGNMAIALAAFILIIAEIGGILEEAFPGAYKGTKMDNDIGPIGAGTVLPPIRKRKSSRSQY